MGCLAFIRASMALRQFGQVVLGLAPMGTRSMAGAPSVSPAARWSQYFPKAPGKPGNKLYRFWWEPFVNHHHCLAFPCNVAEPTKQEVSKKVRKEMIGFILLGPISAGLMVYDLIFGLEHHEPHPIPPWVHTRQFSQLFVQPSAQMMSRDFC
jgi:hypothetical protein